MDRIIIFDTSLRDGEQAPGFSMNTQEKLEMARQLARLNVDVIEAGFPISSDEDFEAVREVAKQVGTLEGAPIICGLSRVGLADIDRAWEAVIDAGALTINIPDTVGYAIPEEWFNRIMKIREHVKNSSKAVLSVHCHNDLGQAVANALAAIRAGARQIECTINGIGERAGNASLEEIVMALKTRKDFFETDTQVRTEEIFKSSRLLSSITGVHVQPNKAVVGENAFAHEAGIHQDGVLKEKLTYEIMRPEDIGRPSNKLVLGK